jgi:SAM-dependent methyltransferase
MFPQEKAWLQAVERKKKIEGSAVLSWINRRIRIPLSVSAQRDRFFLKHIPRGRPKQEILDVGCGSGRQYLAQLGVVTGIDLSGPLLEEAKGIYNEVVLHDILDMSRVFGGKQFDVVTSSDVIGHIPFERKKDLYDELAKVTKPGGLSVHFIECKHDTFWTNIVQRRWPELFQKHFIDRVGHIGMESVPEIRRQFTDRSFNVVSLEKTPGFFQEVGILSAQLNYADVAAVAPGWLRLCVKCDAAMSGNIWLRELLNIGMRPFTALENTLTAEVKTTAIMIVARRA